MVSVDRVRQRILASLLKASQEVEAAVKGRRFALEPSSYGETITADLIAQGVHVTSVERLFGAAAPVLRAAMAIVRDLLNPDRPGSNDRPWVEMAISHDLAAEVLLDRVPELFLIGLHERILSIVQHYLRLPVAFHGVAVRHSRLGGRSEGPRLWHRDGEDFHVFRMLIYVTDVDDGSGPFEYIPRAEKLTYSHFRGIVGGLTDDRMRSVVPEKNWRRCTGPAGTVVIADTGATFHHESLQKDSDRCVVMFGYSTRRPRNCELSMSHFPVERVRNRLDRLLLPEHHEYVYGWRKVRA